MKLLGSTKKMLIKIKMEKTYQNQNHLKLFYFSNCFDLVKNDYQHTSKVLFTFFPNKEFGQLINISPHTFTMMNTVNTEFSSVEVWFTDQVSKALEIEDNVNLTLIIG